MFANTNPRLDTTPPSYVAAATMPPPTSPSPVELHSAPPTPAKDSVASPSTGQLSAPPDPAEHYLTPNPAPPTAMVPTPGPPTPVPGSPTPLRAISPTPIPALFPTSLPPRPAPDRHPWNLRFCMFPRPTIAPRPQDTEMGVLPERRVPLDNQGHRDIGGRGLMDSPVPEEWNSERRKRKYWWVVGTLGIVVVLWMLIVMGIKIGDRNDVGRNVKGGEFEQ
jgi:hypothetical protein